MLKTGEPGGSPEIYEKINPKTGKGCVVIFANAPGSYRYITNKRVVKNFWATNGVDLKNDAQGHAIISVQFTEPSARIIFFGIN
jgi:hypothetical protein